MNIHAPKLMTVDEFLRWYQKQERGRYELQDGRVIMQQSQSIGHITTKTRVLALLAEAIERTGVACYALGDGATVRIDPDTTCEPDALVAPLPQPPPSALEVPNPLIVVEVLSPSSKTRDLKTKVANYARVPSIAHYLIIDPAGKTVRHHTAATMAVGGRPRNLGNSGTLLLDPPGLEIDVATLFRGCG